MYTRLFALKDLDVVTGLENGNGGFARRIRNDGEVDDALAGLDVLAARKLCNLLQSRVDVFEDELVDFEDELLPQVSEDDVDLDMD